MATVTRTFFVDDPDGSTEDVENVRISVDGADFEIDLSGANAARLREKLAKYVDHGTRVIPAVREWARKNGHAVSAADSSPRPCWTPSPPLTDIPRPNHRFVLAVLVT